MGVLVPCKTCKKQIDNEAKSCPHCGASNPGKTGGCFVILLAIFFGIISIYFIVTPTEKYPETPATGDYSTVNDTAAKSEIAKINGVISSYVSPGHMNVFVNPIAKDWTSPTIAINVCAVLRNNGSHLTWVRFVNNYGFNGSLSDFEISKFTCRDIL
jgi:hypothetical protein